MPSQANELIEKTLNDSYREVEDLINLFKTEMLDAFPGRSKLETLELRILEVLNKARNRTGDIVAEYADTSSHTMIMTDSGARGNPLNLAQMAACVGQQSMRGKRIEKGYYDRTLS